MITKYDGRDNDRSIKVVDDRSEADFLNAFKTKYQYWRTGYVKANEFSLEVKAKIMFSSADQLIDSIRNKNQFNMEDWRRADLIDTKKRFWQAGFANYEDIEYLCFRLLDKRKDITNAISKRFPLILVDECQDLSNSQLQILQKLLEQGCNLHFVGDLNQGIYSFRNVNPDLVRQFVTNNNFLQNKLTNNFRSLQPIVNFCGKLVEQDAVTGRQYLGKESICLYITYDKQDIVLLPDRFLKCLMSRNLSISDSVILARNNNTVSKLRPVTGVNLHIALLPVAALKVWQTQNISIDQITEALACMGKFIANRYFSSDSANTMSYYCPIGVKSQISWRLFVSDVLDLCVKHEKLSNLELTWKQWANLFRKSFDNIVILCQSKYDDIHIDPSHASLQYKVPKGESAKKVSTTLGIIESAHSQQIRITNFHQIKGETKEAVMVVSAPTNAGGSEGYWKNWLVDKQSENARFAYVASSRPRRLLVWAIPNPITKEEKETLSNLGMEYVSDF